MKTGMKLVIVALFGLMFAMGSGCGPAPAGNANQLPDQSNQPPNQLPGQPVCDAPTDERVCVTVDYSRTLAEMIQAGKYDNVTGSEWLVEANFPIQRPVGGEPVIKKVELILVFGYGDDLYRGHSLSQVVQYFDAHPELRYARIEEILALGEQYPDFKNDSPQDTVIISLGSFFTSAPDGHHYLSYITSNYRNGIKFRMFGGQYWEPGQTGYGQFGSRAIFPAVRK